MRDLTYAFRKLLKAPLFSVVAILCLALGIGANTAIFSLVNSILLRPLPFGDIDRLVFMGDVFREPGSEGQRVGVTPRNFETLRERNQVFTSMGAVYRSDYAITGDGEPEYVQGAVVTHDWLPTLGLEPRLGRSLAAEEDRPGTPARVAVVSHSLWQRRFGGGEILGRDVVLDGESYEIVGVLPEAVQFPYQAELWVPMGLDPDGENRNEHFLGVFGRTKPGVSLEQVRTDLDRIYSQLAEEYPESNAGWSYELLPMREELLRGIEPRLAMLFAAVGFLLLIACANVANMMLARAQERRGEITLRLALGASRGQLVRQLLAESLVVALLGGLVGLFLAQLVIGPLVVLSPIATMNTFFQQISIDHRVLAFTLLVSVAVGVFFGLLPAWRATRPELEGVFQAGGQRSSGSRQGRRLLSALVVAEVAIAVVLLIGAGLVIDSLRRLSNADPGFDVENVLTLRMTLPGARYPDVATMTSFVGNLVERVEALPGVESAGAGAALPLATLGADQWLGAGTVEGRPLSSPNDFIIFNHRYVSPGYLETLRIPLLRGRYFTSQDQEGSQPVVVVSRETERLFWPGESAVGKRLKRGMADSTNPWMTIVGVVENVADLGLGVDVSDVGPTWYLPYTQHADNNVLDLVVRTSVPPRRLVQPVRDVAAGLDPELPLYAVDTMDERLAVSYRPQRFIALLLSFFAALGLALSAIGIYGVMSYAVVQQFREIGVRMALGADAGRVVRFVVERGLLMAGIGLAIGLAGALALSRVLASAFTEVTIDPGEVTVYLLIALGLLLVALVACVVPAYRASRIDPIRALRES